MACSSSALTRLEPAVEDVLDAAQLALALPAGDGQVVDEVAVQVRHLGGGWLGSTGGGWGTQGACTFNWRVQLEVVGAADAVR